MTKVHHRLALHSLEVQRQFFVRSPRSCWTVVTATEPEMLRFREETCKACVKCSSESSVAARGRSVGVKSFAEPSETRFSRGTEVAEDQLYHLSTSFLPARLASSFSFRCVFLKLPSVSKKAATAGVIAVFKVSAISEACSLSHVHAPQNGLSAYFTSVLHLDTNPAQARNGVCPPAAQTYISAAAFQMAGFNFTLTPPTPTQ